MADGSLSWLSMRVPMWALLAASLGAGATSIAGGSWRWMENNEPRLASMSERLALVERDVADLRVSYADLKTEVVNNLAGVRLDLAKKVDDTTRREMLAALLERINGIDRHLEAIDTRITSVADRVYGMQRYGGDAERPQGFAR